MFDYYNSNIELIYKYINKCYYAYFKYIHNSLRNIQTRHSEPRYELTMQTR